MRVVCLSTREKMTRVDTGKRRSGIERAAVSVALAATAVGAVFVGPDVALADLRLPPIDKDPNRCERAFVGNTIGQSNAVSDRVLDLRYCELPGADLHGTDGGKSMNEVYIYIYIHIFARLG